MSNYHYLRPFWRVLIAFIATFTILFLGQPLHLDVAFVSPRFYRAFVVSFGTTLLLMYGVHVATIWLDRWAPWRTMPLRRSALQLLFGIIIPAVGDIILMAIFYFLIGRDMIEVGFFYLDFPFAVMFLLSFNIFYFGLHLWHLVTHREDELDDVLDLLEAEDENDALAQLEVKFEGGIIRLDVREEVLYFFRDKRTRKVMAVTVTSHSYVIQDTLSALLARFTPVGFCQINPSVIVNLKMLQGYGQGPRRATLRVVFRENYQAVIGLPRDKKYRVTREHIGHLQDSFKAASTSIEH